jgi:hypothetical protein
MTTSSKKDVNKVCDALFIARYHALFHEFLPVLDSASRHMIRNNPQLNQMYDLVLDFVLDSAHQLHHNMQTKE